MADRIVMPPIRALFWGVGCAFSGVAGLLLFLFPERTETLFAWTIARGDTAAFIGACFLGFSLLSFLCYGVAEWRGVRHCYLGTLAFVTTMTVTTLFHLDQFNFGGGEPVAMVMAWGWTAVYLVAPVGGGLLLSRQLREPGSDVGPATPIVPGLRYLYLAQGTLLAVVGVVLFLAPGRAETLWPWPLTTLTARAVAAFLLGLGVMLVGVGREDAAEILEPPGAACWWTALLAGMAVTRFEGSVELGSVKGMLWCLVAVSLLLSGVAGELAARRLRAGPRPSDPPAPPAPPKPPRPRRPIEG